MISKAEAQLFIGKRVAVRFEDEGRRLVYYGILDSVSETAVLISNSRQQGLVPLAKILAIREEVART